MRRTVSWMVFAAIVLVVAAPATAQEEAASIWRSAEAEPSVLGPVSRSSSGVGIRSTCSESTPVSCSDGHRPAQP